MKIRFLTILVPAVFLAACAKQDVIPRDPDVRVARLEKVSQTAARKNAGDEGKREAQNTGSVQSADKVQIEIKPGVVSRMDLTRLFAMRQNAKVFLVDVRPGIFYHFGHIPGAESMPRHSFSKKFPELKNRFDAALGEGKTIVLYCTDKDCPDARAVAAKMAAKGYSTTVYTGGWAEWEKSGL